jgi:hypothetical protein
MKVFKIRASAIGKIMTGNIGLTDNQEIDLKTLSEKEKLTPKQEIKLNDLKYKKANPELPEGAKTYCKQWLKEQVYNRGKYFANKYTDKGNIMEDDSIDFIAKMLDFGMLLKNNREFENEFITGTPDIITSECVIDAKNSWSFDSFPILESKPTTKDYPWQLQGYMDLTNHNHAKLCYVLSNTPDHLIDREARIFSIENGFEELDAVIYKEVYDRLNYDEIDDKLRIKTFEFERNQDEINQIYERVKLCRVYIEQLIKQLPSESIRL